MPQAIPYIIAFAKAAAPYLLRAAAMALIQKALIKKPNPGAFPLNVTVRSTIAARRLVFGTVRASGAMVFCATSGSNNKHLWYVIAYAGHQCSALKDLYLDKFKIAAADINGSTGAVSTAVLDGKLKCWDHLGTGAQAVDTNLDTDFTEWTSNHRLRGICYRVLRFERSDKAFPTGAPESCTSVVDGMLHYDPQLDSTNGGAGSHRRDDPSTWAFSRNSALALRSYVSGGSVVNDQVTRLIRYGLKEADSRILDSYTRAAAAICAQSLSGANAPPSGAQPRYTCDLEVACDEPRREILENILATMGPGQLVQVHGQWRMYAAEYTAPVHTFTELDLVDGLGVDIDDTTGDDERLNQVSAVYIDAAKDYTEQSTPVRTNAAYVTQDGGKELFDEVSLRGVTDEYRAQRLAELALRRSRQMRRIRIPFGRQGLKIAPWETFTFDHSGYGWSGRVFRCIVAREIEYNETGGMIVWVTAIAEASSIYTDLVTADYTTGTSVTNSLQSEAPDPPTSLSAVALPRAIEFRWTLGEFWRQNGIVELIRHTASTPSSSGTVVWRGRGDRAVVQIEDSAVYYWWVRIATIGGQTSATEPASTGYAAAAMRDSTILSDANFELATDSTYWQATNGYASSSAATGVAIVNSGGVTAGVLQLTGDSTTKVVWNKRSTLFPVITGQSIRCRFRWRRTNTISSALTTDQIFGMAFSTTGGDIPPASLVGGASLYKTRADINAVNVNEWQEDEFTGTVANQPKSSTQLPHLQVTIDMQPACTGGVIEVDQLQAHLN
jgi:hypothetical protein